ncbi:MAG TPA: hypothetical protein VMY36_04205 [Patescibacteria group bacterium]|nr:hypothetical protein [Patescibacteria group bacterium]
MKKPILLLSIFLSFSLFSVGALAQEDEDALSSPIPSPDDERIKEQVQERIENVLQAADEEKKGALVGTLKSIANSTLTIEIESGDAQVKIDDETVIINPDRDEIELEDLSVGSKIIALGYTESQTTLNSKRIIVIEEFQTPETEVVFGVVTDISQEEKVLTIKHPKNENIYMIEIGSQTTITKKIDEEIEKISFSDIEEDDRLVVVGIPGENGEKMVTADLIRVVTN